MLGQKKVSTTVLLALFYIIVISETIYLVDWKVACFARSVFLGGKCPSSNWLQLLLLLFWYLLPFTMPVCYHCGLNGLENSLQATARQRLWVGASLPPKPPVALMLHCQIQPVSGSTGRRNRLPSAAHRLQFPLKARHIGNASSFLLFMQQIWECLFPKGVPDDFFVCVYRCVAELRPQVMGRVCGEDH